MEENMGEGKALPGLPVCKFGSKSIPGLICMSSKVSISSKILSEALKYLDKINVFKQCQDGPTPFGLLDGHVSRLQLPLLKYINSKTPDWLRKWIQTLRTPNTTNVWQLVDSSNQNVCWNMATTVYKDAPIRFKQRHEFESTDFDRCDIVPLINRVWKKSFARSEKNLFRTPYYLLLVWYLWLGWYNYGLML